ncbi:hypothetical protein HID58_091518 [Brassica napus]|uniref:Uncharacterized protein n=1 Tax=Brassica napus TaxID=3708 RepID=A0ABQ7X1V5_BRANA|nr:hypothetical protein HID58_091518 [Brassica napus]
MNTGQDEEPLPSTGTREQTRRSSAADEIKPQKKPIFERLEPTSRICGIFDDGDKLEDAKTINWEEESSELQNERQSDEEEQIRRSNGAGENDTEEVIASRRHKPAKPSLTKPRLPRVRSQPFFTEG